MKTLKVKDETHKMIKDIVKELKDKYGLRITIESIVDSALKKECRIMMVLENDRN